MQRAMFHCWTFISLPTTVAGSLHTREPIVLLPPPLPSPKNQMIKAVASLPTLITVIFLRKTSVLLLQQAGGARAALPLLLQKRIKRDIGTTATT